MLADYCKARSSDMTCEHHWQVIMGVLDGKVISSGYITAPNVSSPPPPARQVRTPKGIRGDGRKCRLAATQEQDPRSNSQLPLLEWDFSNPLPHQGYSGRLAQWPRFSAFDTSTSEETMTPK